MTVSVDFNKEPDGYFDGIPYWLGTAHPDDLIFESNYRKTFDERQQLELDRDIAAKGLGNEIMVLFKRTKATIIDGHRRARSVKRIWKNQSRYQVGEKYDPELVKVKVFRGPLDEEEILKIQISTNLHEKPPADQEAEAIYFLWTRASKRGWNVARFARESGMTPSKVRKAIRFIEDAEPMVVDMVRGKSLTYAAGVLLAKVKDRAKQSELAEWAFVKEFKTATQIKRRVYEVLQAEYQESFELSLVTVSPLSLHRAALYGSLDRNFYDGIAFIQRLLKATDDGYLPSELLTKTAKEKILLATQIHGRILADLEFRKPLLELFQASVATCEHCLCQRRCSTKKVKPSSQCVELVSEEFYRLVGISKEAGDISREKAV